MKNINYLKFVGKGERVHQNYILLENNLFSKKVFVWMRYMSILFSYLILLHIYFDHLTYINATVFPFEITQLPRNSRPLDNLSVHNKEI